MNNISYLLLRLTVAIIFLIHALYRVSTGIVEDFGIFFTSLGWPYGFFIAWLVTSLELISSGLLFLGRLVSVSAVYLIIQTISGVFLVHWQFGWFVVGAGRNGMEYSFLLTTCLVILLLQTRSD